MLTQTAINNATERCYILTRMYPNAVDPETYFQVLYFLNKLRTNNKMNKIMAPIAIEPDHEHRGIRFEWMKIHDDKKMDELDVIFHSEPFITVKANYNSLNLELSTRIQLDDDFQEHIIIHLKNFVGKRKRKKYK
jgi:hypothetical protein